MKIITDAGLFALAPDGAPNYVTQLSSADLSVGTYSIPAGGVDDQSPHTEDEVYVVTSGRATLVTPSGAAGVGPGSVVFVPAGERHTFTSITEDLTLLVFFAPPYGSRALVADGGAVLRAAAAGQLVGFLVAGIAGVALDPLPVDVVVAGGLCESLPQIDVLDRLLG